MNKSQYFNDRQAMPLSNGGQVTNGTAYQEGYHEQYFHWTEYINYSHSLGTSLLFNSRHRSEAYIFYPTDKHSFSGICNRKNVFLY